MKDFNRRLENLEQRIKGDGSERIAITIASETLTFKNSKEMAKIWIEAVISADAESRHSTQPTEEVKGLENSQEEK